MASAQGQMSASGNERLQPVRAAAASTATATATVMSAPATSFDNLVLATPAVVLSEWPTPPFIALDGKPAEPHPQRSPDSSVQQLSTASILGPLDSPPRAHSPQLLASPIPMMHEWATPEQSLDGDYCDGGSGQSVDGAESHHPLFHSTRSTFSHAPSLAFSIDACNMLISPPRSASRSLSNSASQSPATQPPQHRLTLPDLQLSSSISPRVSPQLQPVSSLAVDSNWPMLSRPNSLSPRPSPTGRSMQSAFKARAGSSFTSLNGTPPETSQVMQVPSNISVALASSSPQVQLLALPPALLDSSILMNISPSPHPTPPPSAHVYAPSHMLRPVVVLGAESSASSTVGSRITVPRTNPSIYQPYSPPLHMRRAQSAISSCTSPDVSRLQLESPLVNSASSTTVSPGPIRRTAPKASKRPSSAAQLRASAVRSRRQKHIADIEARLIVLDDFVETVRQVKASGRDLGPEIDVELAHIATLPPLTRVVTPPPGQPSHSQATTPVSVPSAVPLAAPSISTFSSHLLQQPSGALPSAVQGVHVPSLLAPSSQPLFGDAASSLLSSIPSAPKATNKKPKARR